MFGAPEDAEHFDAWLADQQQLANDDASAPGGGADQPPAPVSQRLADLCANFNPTNILRASKAARRSLSTNPTTNASSSTSTKQRLNHPDGKHRQVPPSWTFPKLCLQSMYQYWHCGDESSHIPAMKFLVASDVDFLGKGHTLVFMISKG
jgi:hypothetical protein